MYFKSRFYSILDVLDANDVSYSVIDDSDLAEEIDTEDLIDELKSRRDIGEVLWHGKFEFSKEDKKILIQRILGYNKLADYSDMVDDFKKLFA